MIALGAIRDDDRDDGGARGARSGFEKGLAGRLKLLILVRVVAVTSLSLVMLLLELEEKRPMLAGESERVLYAISWAVYLLSLGYTFALRMLKSPVGLQRLAWVQLIGDALFVGFLVALTRLSDSVFVFLFLVVIVVASILLPRRGVLVIAVLCTLELLAVGLFQLNMERFDTILGIPVSFLVKATERHTLSGTGGIIYNLIVNTLAFFSVALLTQYLSEQLRRAGLVLLENRENLEYLRTRHRLIVESLPVGLLTTTRAGQIADVNTAGELIRGLALEEMGTRSVFEVFPALGRTLGGVSPERPARLETASFNEEGQRVNLRWTISPLHARGGEPMGAVYIFEDVTQLVQAREEAERQERFATVGRLAAGIAHEIRNPLASISGSIQIVRNTTGLSEKNVRLTDIVLREVDGLNRRVTDLLTYARPRPMVYASINMAALLEEMIEVFRHDASASSRDIQLGSCDTGGREARGDPERLRQILWNLFSNAMDATEDGDSIDLGCERGVREGLPGVVFWVRDTGKGISEDDALRAVEPFFTTREGGTGLGLAIVQRFVEEHRGQLTIAGVPGEGTTVSVFIPSVEAGSQASRLVDDVSATPGERADDSAD